MKHVKPGVHHADQYTWRRMEMFISSATALSMVEKARPAVREQRQRDADDGQHADRHPHVDDRVPEEDGRDADREHGTEAVLRLRRHGIDHSAGSRRGRSTATQPTKPYSWAHTGEGEVGERVREEPRWFCVPAETRAQQAPAPIAMIEWCA